MMLLWVELRRFCNRRAVVVLVVLGALAIGAVAAGVLYENRPVTESERAAAVAEAEMYNNEPATQRRIARCVERGSTEEQCVQRFGFSPEFLLYRSQLKPHQFKLWLIPMVGIAAAVSLLIGSTFVGADYSSGSIGTQLVFEPRRSRVWGTKTAAVALGTGAFTVVALALANGAIWFAAQAWDRPMRDGLFTDYASAAGRGVLLVMAAGVGGYAIGVLSRHTAAALGLLAVYGIAGEAVMRLVWPSTERWLLSNHLVAWVGGDWRLEQYNDACFSGDCLPRVIEFTIPGTLTYLGLLAVAVAGVSLLVFQRRDVA
jgi:ABC-2 type transport system permease protein